MRGDTTNNFRGLLRVRMDTDHIKRRTDAVKERLPLSVAGFIHRITERSSSKRGARILADRRTGRCQRVAEPRQVGSSQGYRSMVTVIPAVMFIKNLPQIDILAD